MKHPTTLIYLSLLLAAAAPAAAIDVGGDANAGRAKAQTCVACHGADGNSRNAQFPKIAELGAPYIYKQLVDYKEGRRVNAVMAGIVAALSDQDMRDLATYFANQTRTGGVADEAQTELGELVYRGGNSATGVPDCSGCHAPEGVGNPAAKFPGLAGQHSQYLVTQLHAFRRGERANDAGQMMRNIASKLSEQEIEAVAEYIAGLRSDDVPTEP
jgi:cytochrome c553